MSPRKQQAKAASTVIEKEARLRTYECTYLIPTTADAAKVSAEVTAAVKKYNGTVVSSEDWGKKELSYMIKKSGERHTQATYTHLVIEMDAEQAPQFERDLYLNTTILRHLVVVAEPVKDTTASTDVQVVEVSSSEDEE